MSELAMAVQAKWRLRKVLLQADRIGSRQLGMDRYGRVLTALLVDGESLGDRMMASGLARRYLARRYDGGQRGSWCG